MGGVGRPRVRPKPKMMWLNVGLLDVKKMGIWLFGFGWVGGGVGGVAFLMGGSGPGGRLDIRCGWGRGECRTCGNTTRLGNTVTQLPGGCMLTL